MGTQEGVSAGALSAIDAPFAYINGLRVFAFRSREDLIAQVAAHPHLLIALNAEKLSRPRQAIREMVNRHVGYPDGAGAVLALRRKGLRSARIPGTELWLEFVRRFEGSRSFYLVGSTDDVVSQTVARLRDRFPQLEIVNYRNGFLETDDSGALVADIERRRPDVVLVAMGSPRQELLMKRLYAAHPAIYLGLGGSFDVFVGRKPRAPRWLQQIGLEWAYQFVRTPRRLHRLPSYLRFAWLLIRNQI